MIDKDHTVKAYVKPNLVKRDQVKNITEGDAQVVMTTGPVAI